MSKTSVPRDTKMVIVVRKDLQMRKGKIAAQVAHAAMGFIVANCDLSSRGDLTSKLKQEEVEWLNGAHAKIVVGIDTEQELLDLITKAEFKDVEVYAVTDAGRTEFHGVPTLTCAALGPGYIERLDELTGHLKLL